MKRITKFALTIAVVLFASNVFAQSFGEIFNGANELVQAGKNVEAAAQFTQALKLAVAAGEEGDEVAAQCKEIVPALLNKAAAEKAKEGDLAGAKDVYNQLKSFGEEFTLAEVVDKAKAGLNQVQMMEGDKALNAKDFAGAVAIYNKVLEADPNNTTALSRIGLAENAAGNTDKAVAALKKAKELGLADADAQLGNIYNNQMAKALKVKDYATVLKAAENAIEVAPNNNAYTYGGIAAYNLKNYTKAINLLKKAEPSANVNYYIAQSYEKAGNKAQACAYYRKLTGDAKFGAFAKQKVATCK